jgi:hypothetical protein
MFDLVLRLGMPTAATVFIFLRHSPFVSARKRERSGVRSGHNAILTIGRVVAEEEYNSDVIQKVIR